jgi:hypothetical protein
MTNAMAVLLQLRALAAVHDWQIVLWKERRGPYCGELLNEDGRPVRSWHAPTLRAFVFQLGLERANLRVALRGPA